MALSSFDPKLTLLLLLFLDLDQIRLQKNNKNEHFSLIYQEKRGQFIIVMNSIGYARFISWRISTSGSALP